jgi:hypothetical protein
MTGSEPFGVTEWDWFQIRLRVLYLELRGPRLVTTFQFRTDRGPDAFSFRRLGDEILVICNIWCSTTDELIKKKETRNRQLEFYSSWVASTKAQIASVLDEFPNLRRAFSPERNVAFVILNDYGMGSLEVCRIIGDKISWLADRTAKER